MRNAECGTKVFSVQFSVFSLQEAANVWWTKLCAACKKRMVMDEPTIAQKCPIVQKVEPGIYWWCACGRSKSQPFCDGSHEGTGFVPQEVKITEAKMVAWCACKHSKKMPFCDGSHSTL